MAAGEGRRGIVDIGTTINAARSPMLIPHLVRLTDSEIEEADRVVAQASNRVENGRGVLEEVGPAGLLIHQKAASA